MFLFCRMLLSACSSNCKCGDDCVNKPFQQRPVKKLKLVQVLFFMVMLEGLELLITFFFLFTFWFISFVLLLKFFFNTILCVQDP